MKGILAKEGGEHARLSDFKSPSVSAFPEEHIFPLPEDKRDQCDIKETQMGVGHSKHENPVQGRMSLVGLSAKHKSPVQGRMNLVGGSGGVVLTVQRGDQLLDFKVLECPDLNPIQFPQSPCDIREVAVSTKSTVVDRETQGTGVVLPTDSLKELPHVLASTSSIGQSCEEVISNQRLAQWVDGEDEDAIIPMRGEG